MDWKTSLYYIIPAVIILILIFPIFLEMRMSFNPLENRGVISLFVFNKKIFCYIFCIKGKMIELLNEKDKLKTLDFNSPEFAIMQEFGRQLQNKIRLKKCYVFYNIGMGDAFLSALLCGYINLILTQIFLIVKSKKPTASFCIYDTISYNRLSSEFALRVEIAVSFFEVVYSYLYSVIITKKK